MQHKNQRTSKLIFNAVSALIARVVNLLVNIFSLPLLLSYLGHPTFGVFAMIISITSMISFSDLGLSLGLLNNVPKYKADNDPNKLVKVITGSFVIVSIVSIILLTLFLMIYSSTNWAELLNVHDSVSREAVPKMVFAFIVIYLLGAPFNVSSNYLIGNQQGFYVETGRAIGNLIMLLLIFIAIRLKMQPYVLVAITLASTTLITILTYFILFTKGQSSLRPRLKYFEWKTTKSLFSDSSRYFILQIFTLLLVSLDPILIGKILNTESVTKYSVIYRIATIVSLPSVLLVSQMLPSLNDAFISNDKEWIKNAIDKILYSSLIYIAFMGILFCLVGNKIIVLWLGNSFDFSINQWLVITIFLTMLILNSIFSMIFLMPSFLKFTLTIFPISVVGFFILKIYLLNHYGLSEMIGFGSAFYLMAYCLPCLLYLKTTKFI